MIKKFIYKILKIAIGCVFSQITSSFAYYENPHQKFDMKNNITNNTYITFRQVKNVTLACEKESRSRGHSGFGIPVEACSFWSSNKILGTDECLIITAGTANFHTIGHEVRHCLQGNWHK
jgi:hypothetical protein